MTPTAPITRDVMTLPRKLPDGSVNQVKGEIGMEP